MCVRGGRKREERRHRKVGGLAAGAGVRVRESKVGIDYIINLIGIGTDKYLILAGYGGKNYSEPLRVQNR